MSEREQPGRDLDEGEAGLPADAAMPEDSSVGLPGGEEPSAAGASALPGEPGGASEAGLGGGEGDLGGGGDLANDFGGLDEEDDELGPQ